ncbi:MAG: PIN domain-containing protein, partial [Muribaculaceae bacterium]|nr:PIN domain-containing protein [Muribaculaceae bacterium]
MRRVFLDTNFIIDYFIREDYCGDAEKVLKLKDTNNLEFFISYLTVANFAYIMRKLSPQSLRELIANICDTFNIVDNTKDQILQNLDNNANDFEDGLQYQAAVSAGCGCLITRNKKDFTFAKIPVLTPSEFVSCFG